MIMKYLNRLTLLLLLSVFTFACEKEDPPEQENPDETQIREESKTETISSSSGGTIELESGILIDIPSGALSSDLSITVEILDLYLEKNKYELAKEVKGTVVSPLVRCSPEGATFEEAIQITIPYYPELFPENLPEDSIQVVSYSGGYIDSHPFTLDQTNNLVVAETDHFSDFVILADRDILVDRGRIYNTVRIGEQVWMAENLAFLPEVHAPTDTSYSKPRYYVYDYDGTSIEEARATANFFQYGVLYNWKAALEAAPEGWHIPSDDEWKELELFIGMDPEHLELGSDARERGPGLCDKLKSNYGWSNFERAVDGTDDFGFRALPAGFFAPWNMEFRNLGVYTWFWAAPNAGEDIMNPWTRRLSRWAEASIYRDNDQSELVVSIRCIKD